MANMVAQAATEATGTKVYYLNAGSYRVWVSRGKVVRGNVQEMGS